MCVQRCENCSEKAEKKSGHLLSWLQRTKRVFRRAYRKLGFKHLLPLLFVAIYTLIGGVLFLWIENAHDVESKRINGQLWMQRRENATAQLVHEITTDERELFVFIPSFHLPFVFYPPHGHTLCRQEQGSAPVDDYTYTDTYYDNFFVAR